jgi:hypothetical protein
LWIERSRFEQAIDLPAQAIDGGLSLEAPFGAKPDGALPSINLGARIEGSLSAAAKRRRRREDLIV